MAFKINGIQVAGLGTNGAGVPAGGSSTQILQKNSNVDFDTSWVDAPIIPIKTSEIENDSDFATNASVDEKLQSHRNNTEIHITAEERELWNSANTYTDTAIANLVGSAPDTLNTLEEISKALNEDAEYVINLASKVDTKQDTLTGELNQVISFDADGKVISKTLIASDVGAVDADYVAGEISAVEAEIDLKADKSYVDELIAGIPTESDIVIVDCPDGSIISHTFDQIITAINEGKVVYASAYETIKMSLTYVADDNSFIEFRAGYSNNQIYSLKINNDNTFTLENIKILHDEPEYNAVILKSSTPGSTKKFKITIDDSGVLTASEIE